MTSKIPNTSQGTTPERGRLKAPRKPTIPAIRAFIAEQGRVTVYAGKEYATAFRAPPLDGNVYIVEDPKRRGVLHWTDRQGILTWHTELPPFVVDGLVRAASVTVFLVDPRINVRFGEGFAITRPKPLCGKLPSTLYVWYIERDGLLVCNTDNGVEDRQAMGKQVEIWERQERIARIMADREARGLPKLQQKTIAEELGVDPATVTRDMRAIRSRWKLQEALRMKSAPRPKDET